MRTKGCINPKCKAHKDKRKYYEKDVVCAVCGEKLAFVCDVCYTPIGDKPKMNLCKLCEAKKQVKKQHTKDVMGKVAGVAAVAGSITLGIIGAIAKKKK